MTILFPAELRYAWIQETLSNPFLLLFYAGKKNSIKPVFFSFPSFLFLSFSYFLPSFPSHPGPLPSLPPSLPSFLHWKLEPKIREARCRNIRQSLRPLLHTTLTAVSIKIMTSDYRPRACLDNSEHRAPRSHWQSTAIQKKPICQSKKPKTSIYKGEQTEVKWLLVNNTRTKRTQPPRPMLFLPQKGAFLIAMFVPFFSSLL